MKSDELRFRHVGLSSDGAVIFCDMDNGKTYAMPLGALDRAEDWDPKAKPRSVEIIHDGYAAVVVFSTGIKLDFPSDLVLHVCEPSYIWYKGNGHAASGVGGRIRDLRKRRGLTLEALAAKCGIAKPNLSRLENDKVTPKYETLRAVAAALDADPAFLISDEESGRAWRRARDAFNDWKLSLLSKKSSGDSRMVRAVEMVEEFLATWPQYRYAEMKLKTLANRVPHNPQPAEHSLDIGRWARAKAAREMAKRRETESLPPRHR